MTPDKSAEIAKLERMYPGTAGWETADLAKLGKTEQTPTARSEEHSAGLDETNAQALKPEVAPSETSPPKLGAVGTDKTIIEEVAEFVRRFV
jgi:hypothetical protein